MAATLREKLQDRIAFEDAEIARIKADAITAVQAAQGRKATLLAAVKALTDNPQLESLITELQRIGIRITE